MGPLALVPGTSLFGSTMAPGPSCWRQLLYAKLTRSIQPFEKDFTSWSSKPS